MSSPDERVSALEAHRMGDQRQLTDITTKLDTLDSKVDQINLRLSRQAGFVAGVMAVVLPVWSVLTVAAGSIWDKLSGGAS